MPVNSNNDGLGIPAFLDRRTSTPDHTDQLPTNAARSGEYDRAIGALLGLAIGDALGTTLEFSARDTKEPVCDLVGGGPFNLQPGEWTDDTSMALALATSLITCGMLDENDLMDRFVAWHENGAYSHNGRCFDIGTTTKAALQKYKATGDPLSGSREAYTAGNGSLMRLSPVAIRYFSDRDELRRVAARQSMTTHSAQEAVDACVAFAELLADAIMGLPHSELLRPRAGGFIAGIDNILAGSWCDKSRDQIMSSGYVVHSLEAALWAVGNTSDYREAVTLAANLGNDADTVAAITGQLAGAIWGANAIPEDWLDQLASRNRIESLGAALFETATSTQPIVPKEELNSNVGADAALGVTPERQT